MLTLGGMPTESEAIALAPHPAMRGYYADASAKRDFLTNIFDRAACDYDFVERLLSWGKGSSYRRQALTRAGLSAGMRMLDVGVGTGLVAREAIALLGDPRLVVGLDPSAGMVRHAADALHIPAILGVAENLPVASGHFEFVSMGYALRHLADVNQAFAEFFRVLRPGGRLCLLEITAPKRPLARFIMRAYMRGVVPMLTRFATGRRQSQLLWQYYWDTIDACIPPETLLDALERSGFAAAQRYLELGIFSEYTAIKPG